MDFKSMTLICMVASGICAASEYYVDNVKGNDANDGLSPNTPWATLAKVNAAPLQPGDRVLFHRGGLWRDTLKLHSGSPEKPIVYSNYGEGPLPLIQPSIAADAPTDWQEAAPGVWTLADKIADTISVDVGNIVFDHGAVPCGWKRWKPEDLSQEGHYVYLGEKHNILLKYPENPGVRHKSVELVLRRFGVSHGNVHDAVVDGLGIRYVGAHGFGGSNATRFVIRNCELSYIGGAHQYTREDGANVRFGNGIEFWCSASDCLVENNRIWEIYDAALTNQGSTGDPKTPSVERNITYRNNTVWNAEYSFEYWNNPEFSITENILVENNTFVDAGHGWAHAQRPDPNGGHLMIYNNRAKTTGFILRNNIFYNSTEVCFRICCGWSPEWPQFSNNLWGNGLNQKELFIMSSVTGKALYYDASNFAELIKQWDPTFNDPVGIPQFMDAAHRDYRLAPGSIGYGKNIGAKP